MLNNLVQKFSSDRTILRSFMALLFIIALGSIFNAKGAFFEFNTHRDLLRQVSVYGILAMGMTVVIISGGIDLSVGSILGLSSVFFSLLTIHHNYSAFIAIVLTLLLALSIGGLSGWLIHQFKIQPFIATLSMMVFARGLAKFISDGQKISQAVQVESGEFIYKDIPAIFNFLDAKIFSNNIAVVTVIFISITLIIFPILKYHRFGRGLLAIGGNEETSRLSGINVGAIKIKAYLISALLACIAGICQAAQEQQGDPEAGNSYELNAIAMAVIGGNSLAGGNGGIPQTFVGVLAIGYLEKILSINAVPESTRLMVTGGIIIIAVLFQKKK